MHIPVLVIGANPHDVLYKYGPSPEEYVVVETKTCIHDGDDPQSVAVCQFCHGTGTYEYEYNPHMLYDFYRIGGRTSGLLRLNPDNYGAGFIAPPFPAQTSTPDPLAVPAWLLRDLYHHGVPRHCDAAPFSALDLPHLLTLADGANRNGTQDPLRVSAVVTQDGLYMDLDTIDNPSDPYLVDVRAIIEHLAPSTLVSVADLHM